jgi:hypothetical protein
VPFYSLFAAVRPFPGAPAVAALCKVLSVKHLSRFTLMPSQLLCALCGHLEEAL